MPRSRLSDRTDHDDSLSFIEIKLTKSAIGFKKSLFFFQESKNF